MTQYIHKDALVAEIKERIETYNKGYANGDDRRTDALEVLLHDIDTLEVKDVDLKEEVERFAKECGYKSAATIDFQFAKHFFELGLKVKQESNDEVKIGEAQIYLEDDGGEPPYDGKQWLDLSCTEYEIPKTLFKDGDNVEILIRKAQKGEEI